VNQKIQFEIVTIFPECFPGVLGLGIIGKALDRGIISIRTHNPRDFVKNRHKSVDDAPYGGGPGMVMKPEPIFLCLDSLEDPPPFKILLSPQGTLWNQSLAQEISSMHHRIALICGRYEGVDERIREAASDIDVSIGDYVIAGGELAAMVVIETISRMIAGVVGDEVSVLTDSLCGNLLKYPQYTRPVEFREMRVPEILLSGNHAEIDKWRTEKAIDRTRNRRPDLFSCKIRSNSDSNSGSCGVDAK
jgi:tRNA (guanine37-N1)-methyltransferase